MSDLITNLLDWVEDVDISNFYFRKVITLEEAKQIYPPNPNEKPADCSTGTINNIGKLDEGSQ